MTARHRPAPLAPPGPEPAERNREIIAARLGWSDGALPACRDLEARYPTHAVWYDTGGLPGRPEPGYTARRRQPRYCAGSPCTTPATRP